MINDGLRTADKDIHSFLMIGQSNMAGRGEFGEVEPLYVSDGQVSKNARADKSRPRNF